jgi:hypothetical protein
MSRPASLVQTAWRRTCAARSPNNTGIANHSKFQSSEFRRGLAHRATNADAVPIGTYHGRASVVGRAVGVIVRRPTSCSSSALDTRSQHDHPNTAHHLEFRCGVAGEAQYDSLPVWVVSVPNVDLKIMSRRTPTDIQWGLVDTTNDWPNIVGRRTMTTPVPAPQDGGAQRATKQPRKDHHVSAKQTSSAGG